MLLMLIVCGKCEERIDILYNSLIVFKSNLVIVDVNFIHAAAVVAR